MRLVSWNCFRGDLLVRTAALDDIDADLIVVQECAAPVECDDNRAVCFGANQKHCLGILARNGFTVRAGPIDPAGGRSVFAVRVDGPVCFNILAVWAQPEPTYVEAIMKGLDAFRVFARDAPTVAIGDFNSHPHFDRYGGPTHGALVERLDHEFGLVSAYHTALGRSRVAPEAATHFWRWKQESGFHIDYCFIPKVWLPALRYADVLDEPAGARQSDHRPIVVELDAAALPTSVPPPDHR